MTQNKEEIETDKLEAARESLQDGLVRGAGDGKDTKSGDYFYYTNSPALGLVRFVGINQNTGGIVVTNEAAPDKHLRTIAGWDHLKLAEPPKGQKQ